MGAGSRLVARRSVLTWWLQGDVSCSAVPAPSCFPRPAAQACSERRGATGDVVTDVPPTRWSSWRGRLSLTAIRVIE